MHAHFTDALMRVAERPPQLFVSGSGSWLVDETGRRYLDFVQGWATNCLGHAPPELAQALSEQARRLINCSPAFFNEPAARLAQLIAAHSCFDQVFAYGRMIDTMVHTRRLKYCRLRPVDLRASRANRVFRADERRIRAENTVTVNTKTSAGGGIYKIVDCGRMCFSSARNR